MNTEPAQAEPHAGPAARSIRLGLRGKLVGSVLVYLLLLAVVGLLGLYAAQASLSGFDIALQHHVREISVLSDVSEAVSRVQSTALLHVVAETPEDKARYERRLTELEANVERLLDEQVRIQRRFADQEDVGRIERFRQVWHAYLQARDEVLLPLSRANRDEEALRLIEPNGAFDRTYQQVIDELSTVQDTLEAESHDRLQESERQFVHNRDLLLGTLLLAGLFGIAFGLAQSSRLARTVQAVSEAARRVAGGDFTPRLALRTGDELESLAESFNVMATNLQRTDQEQRALQRLKDEFVSTVSHELRTPMNGVIGMTDLLLAGELGPRERRYAEAVRRSGEALLGIVDDILDLSKIEAGKLRLEQIALDVHDTIDEVLGLFAARAADQGLELTASVAADVPHRVLGDPVRLRQVLFNLVGNAVKFTPSGLVRVTATVVDRQATHAVLRFQVADTGIGITPEARARLFEPFIQADGSTSRTYGGTGLGLSICKRLVSLMGGSIGVDSKPGVGSTFWFTLPCPLPAATDAMADQAHLPTPAAGAPAAPAGARVLVVEDSWINQQVALGMLEQLGYQADVVGDGRAALRTLAADDGYAAVLLDCQLPGLDGFQTTAEIRRYETEMQRPSHVPIVAVTASAMAGDRERCLAAGMNDYLAKPVRLADLGRILARWTGSAQPTGSTTSPVQLTGSTSPVQPAGSNGSATDQHAAETIEPDEPVLDQAALDALRRLQRPGRPDLVHAVLDRFRADAPQKLADLQAAVASGDASALAMTAHALKGDSGRIGARQVQRVSAELERLGRAGAVADAGALLPRLAEALGRLATEVDATVAS